VAVPLTTTVQRARSSRCTADPTVLLTKAPTDRSCVQISVTPNMYGHLIDPALEKCRGRWLALGDTGVVVADDDSLAELRLRLNSVAPGVHVLVWRIPAPDDPLFLGAAAKGW
jgi:hypothetical protein